MLDFTVQSQDKDISRIGVKGAVTQKKVSRSEKLLPELLGADVYSRKVLMSLQETDFIDSSGINWLLVCHKRFLADGGRLVLHSVPELVDKVLRILRMEMVFEIAKDEESAAQAVNSPRPAPKQAKTTETDEADSEPGGP